MYYGLVVKKVSNQILSVIPDVHVAGKNFIKNSLNNEISEIDTDLADIWVIESQEEPQVGQLLSHNIKNHASLFTPPATQFEILEKRFADIELYLKSSWEEK